MGSSPPMFTEMRVLRESTGDDHLVCSLDQKSLIDVSSLVSARLFCIWGGVILYLSVQVLELGMNFRAADDMRAILAVKLRKRLGFGMWAKLHLLGMHVEGKVIDKWSINIVNIFFSKDIVKTWD